LKKSERKKKKTPQKDKKEGWGSGPRLAEKEARFKKNSAQQKKKTGI